MFFCRRLRPRPLPLPLSTRAAATGVRSTAARGCSTSVRLACPRVRPRGRPQKEKPRPEPASPSSDPPQRRRAPLPRFRPLLARLELRQEPRGRGAPPPAHSLHFHSFTINDSILRFPFVNAPRCCRRHAASLRRPPTPTLPPDTPSVSAQDDAVLGFGVGDGGGRASPFPQNVSADGWRADASFSRFPRPPRTRLRASAPRTPARLRRDWPCAGSRGVSARVRPCRSLCPRRFVRTAFVPPAMLVGRGGRGEEFSPAPSVSVSCLPDGPSVQPPSTLHHRKCHPPAFLVRRQTHAREGAADTAVDGTYPCSPRRRRQARWRRAQRRAQRRPTASG